MNWEKVLTSAFADLIVITIITGGLQLLGVKEVIINVPLVFYGAATLICLFILVGIFWLAGK